MNDFDLFSRRAAVKSAVFGFLTVSIPSVVFAKEDTIRIPFNTSKEDLFHRYPSIDDSIVKEIVGVSHFNFERVKELVNHRPELARATWDWGFGDWETALGAASHVGRRDIAEFLMNHGARPDIFTYAMLGSFEGVKAMIETTPGIQSIAGPHGISLLAHAKYGLRMEDTLTEEQKRNSKQLISYLEKLGNAGVQGEYLEMGEADKEKYLGDYMYGEGPNDGFSIQLNMRKMISLGKLGEFGGGLQQKAENVFLYNGVTSVEITFEIEDDKVISLTVHEPDLVLKAVKV